MSDLALILHCYTKVLVVHKTSKARLGQMPVGAFEQLAQRKQLLAAVAADGSVGIYSVQNRKESGSYHTRNLGVPGRGVVKLLMDPLKHDTRHLLGISLRCRRDYGLGEMRSRFGFTVRNTRRGRGADGALLDLWWFRHNHDDLFSLAAERPDASARVAAAIDANIFYDLTVDGRPHGEDTRVLEADWLEDSLELCITSELFNEIHRAASGLTPVVISAEMFRSARLDAASILITRIHSRLIPFE